jgi:Na+-translocating ferredoxin:NAD+ oxidoreductase RnfC subunit
MDIINKIIDAGIVGAGGAGFPTHEKLKGKVEYFIINAAECEPLLQSDQYIMRTAADKVIKGIEYVSKIITPKNIIIGTKSKYKQEIIELKKSIENSSLNINIYESRSFYPLGDEQVMAQIITGNSVPAGGIPLDINTVVLNVTTVAQIADAVDFNTAVTNKVITVLGEVKSPGLINVPIGISLEKCIEAVGGSNIDKYCVIVGGPMMGKVIDSNETANNYIKKTDGALIILAKDHYIIRRKKADLKNIIRQAQTCCIQCRYCTDMCPRYLIGHTLKPHLIMRNVDKKIFSENILKEALACCECGVCEIYACPMGLSPRMVNAYLKEKFAKEGVRYTKQTGTVKCKNDIEGRRIPTDRLIARLMLSKYKTFDKNKIITVPSSKVKIQLQQHIGRPAKPTVKIGDIVTKGQLIGEINGLCANIHTSINGKITAVTDKYIEIAGKELV